MHLSHDLFSVPAFGRIHDWAGEWMILPAAFEALRATVLATNWAEHMAAGPRPLESTLQMVPVKGGKAIARIDLSGTLMKSASSFGGTSTVQTRRDINAAASDPNVSGILLAIDSPGGTVAGTAELGDAVKAAGRQKPVYAWVDGLAASAAYWAASQADLIFAGNRMSQIGSIGTYATVYDYSQATEAEGIKVHHFTTGPLKGMATPGTAITPEQAEYMQARVNEMQTHFDAAVRAGRGMNASQLAAVKSGAVWQAADALEKRLIDGIKTYEQTLAALASAS